MLSELSNQLFLIDIKKKKKKGNFLERIIFTSIFIKAFYYLLLNIPIIE